MKQMDKKRLTVTKGFGELQTQSIEDSEFYFKSAVSIIDKEFGEGYSREHPELISGLIRTMAIENQGVSISASILQLEEELASSIDALAELIPEKL